MMARPLARHLVRFVVGLAAGSLLFELYLNAAESTPIGRILPVAEMAPYGPDAATGYTHRAGARGMWTTENRASFEINQLGLRDRPGRALNKPVAGTRYAIAGDSVVEALQVPVEATFPALVEAALSLEQRRPIEVVNLGLAGAVPAVIAERLRIEAPRLGLDGAVVSVAMGELTSPGPDASSDYPGYVPGPDGRGVISHDFRETAGYRFRTSASGQAVYWAIDHVRLALVVNNRKNAGLAAELPQAPSRAAPERACVDRVFEASRLIWLGQPAGFANARVDAFLSDIAKIGRDSHMPVVLAVRGLDNACPRNNAHRSTVAAAARRKIEAAGLMFADVDAHVAARLAGGTRRDLFGFGARIGYGHLNQQGHRIYAAVFTDIIKDGLMKAR